MSERPVVTVLNGPNLADLGTREPEIYGSTDQKGLVEMLEKTSDGLGLQIAFEQFDGEGEIISAISEASGASSALVINPGGYSHYSVAILDAMRAFDGPVVEVHISNVFAREPYRSKLVTAAGASALVAGAGVSGYRLALDIVRELLSGAESPEEPQA
jgi:3-dehydroquinate dehydratase-2